MIRTLGRARTSRFSVISTFLAVFFTACAYFYFQYNYTRFATVNFEDWVLYERGEIFIPKSDRYALYFYSSQVKGHKELLERVEEVSQRPVVAIDIHQSPDSSLKDGVIYASTGINTILKYVHRFKVVELPAVVEIERERPMLYRQSAKLRVIPSRLFMERASLGVSR